MVDWAARAARKDRNRAIYKRIVIDKQIASHVADEFGLSRERIRQIMVKEFGIHPDAFRKQRAEVRKAQRVVKLCAVCGEDFTIEGWAAHRKRLRHFGYEGEFYRERDRQIAADYQAGMRLDDLENKYNRDASVIYKSLDRLGIPRRAPNRGRKTKSRLEAAALRAAVAEATARGVSASKIADIFGVTSSFVQKIRQEQRGRNLSHAERSNASRYASRVRWDRQS